MRYSYLGKTELKLPVLSFGASSLGGVFHSIREADGMRAALTAVENGMNFIKAWNACMWTTSTSSTCTT